MTADPKTTAMSSRLFARRAAYVAEKAARWAVVALGDDTSPSDPVPQHVVEAFLQEILRSVNLIARDAPKNG